MPTAGNREETAYPVPMQRLHFANLDVRRTVRKLTTDLFTCDSPIHGRKSRLETDIFCMMFMKRISLLRLSRPTLLRLELMQKDLPAAAVISGKIFGMQEMILQNVSGAMQLRV